MLLTAITAKIHSSTHQLGRLIQQKPNTAGQVQTALEQAFNSALSEQGLHPDTWGTLKSELTQKCADRECVLYENTLNPFFSKARAKRIARQAGREVNDGLTRQMVKQLRTAPAVQVEQLTVPGKTLAQLAQVLGLNVFERLNYGTTHEYIAAKMRQLH